MRRFTVADLGGAGRTPPPHQPPNFSWFHAVFGGKIKCYLSAPHSEGSRPPPLWKSWILHWVVLKSGNISVHSTTLFYPHKNVFPESKIVIGVLSWFQICKHNMDRKIPYIIWTSIPLLSFKEDVFRDHVSFFKSLSAIQTTYDVNIVSSLKTVSEFPIIFTVGSAFEMLSNMNMYKFLTKLPSAFSLPKIDIFYLDTTQFPQINLEISTTYEIPMSGPPFILDHVPGITTHVPSWKTRVTIYFSWYQTNWWTDRI